jgi:hypothetical protein
MSTPTIVPAPGALVLYKAVLLVDYPGIYQAGFINMKHDSKAEWWKVGLREDPDQALARETKIADKEERGPVSKQTHVICKVTFTALGVAYYTMLCKDSGYQFQPTLVKKAYTDDKDWKVWHFHDNLPLQATDENGNVLISAEWMGIQ